MRDPKDNKAIDPHPGRIKKSIQIKVRKMYIIFALLSLGIIAQILITQWGPNGEPLRNLSQDKCFTTEEVEGYRGNVYDRSGAVLTTDARGYRIRLDLHAEALTDSIFNILRPALCDSLSAMFGKSPRYYDDFLIKTRDTCMRKLAKPYYSRPFVTKRALNQWEYNRLRQFPLMQRKYGLIVEPATIRQKLHGSLASYTISSGVEKAYEKEMKASDGVNRFLWLDARHSSKVPIIDTINSPAKDGNDIHTTIDIDLQDVVEGALRRKLEENKALDGTAVVVECSTGEIRAMANLTRHPEGTMEDDFNYAIRWHGSPGSTFKAVSLMALIDEAGLSIDRKINCGTKPSAQINGLTIRDTHVVGNKTGKTTLKGIFVESSNIGFVKTVTDTYGKEPERWVNYINSIGLDKVSDIQRLKGLGFRAIKDPSNRKSGGWSHTTLAQTAYGYELDMTPMQVLMFYNAVANNGKLITPVLVKRIEKDGVVIEEFQTEVVNPAICKPSTLAALKECMEAVITAKEGTGHALSKLPFAVAGKTGTAQVMLPKNRRGQTAYIDKNGNREYLATFVGYFPADNPKYSCIVSIKTPKAASEIKYYTGAGVALPVFKEIAEYIYAHDPEWHTSATKGMASAPHAKRSCDEGVGKAVSVNYGNEQGESFVTEVPDVVGMGLRDALYTLEQAGCKVSFSGQGSVVEQSVVEGKLPCEVRLRLEVTNTK